MQTLVAYFLKTELPEIKEAISEMNKSDNTPIEIISERDVPDNPLCCVEFLVLDANILYQLGIFVQSTRYEKILLKFKPDLDSLANHFFNKIKTK